MHKQLKDFYLTDDEIGLLIGINFSHFRSKYYAINGDKKESFKAKQKIISNFKEWFIDELLVIQPELTPSWELVKRNLIDLNIDVFSSIKAPFHEKIKFSSLLKMGHKNKEQNIGGRFNARLIEFSFLNAMDNNFSKNFRKMLKKRINEMFPVLHDLCYNHVSSFNGGILPEKLSIMYLDGSKYMIDYMKDERDEILRVVDNFSNSENLDKLLKKYKLIMSLYEGDSKLGEILKGICGFDKSYESSKEIRDLCADYVKIEEKEIFQNSISYNIEMFSSAFVDKLNIDKNVHKWYCSSIRTILENRLRGNENLRDVEFSYLANEAPVMMVKFKSVESFYQNIDIINKEQNLMMNFLKNLDSSILKSYGADYNISSFKEDYGRFLSYNEVGSEIKAEKSNGLKFKI